MSSPLTSLAKDLAIDQVLSEGQIHRRFGADVSLAGVLTDVLICDRILPFKKTSKMVRFVVRPSYADLSSTALRHLAGVAELRYLLKARDGWNLVDATQTENPDALWGDIAIEYDAGGYSKHRLRYKLGVLERYPAQIWGSSSAARAKLIARYASEMNIHNLRSVLVAPWA